MHALPNGAKLKSNCPCMLDMIVEYLLLQKFMDGVMDKQCDRNGGTWTNNGQVIITWQQDIWGASNNESIMSLFRSLLSLQQQQKPISDDDDNDGILPFGKWPHEVDHTQEEILSFCTTQIH